ncbi:MAG TPA: VPEID-CTERM sorting domain-containing protein [Candidatus Limnocylindrales bacterium]|nr:VPEID-CTERM sorting domain-containing protein [Candidatus Limnocylindrales bacterium]
MKFIGMALLVVGAASVASAAVPEIDPSTGMNAIALLAGALLIVRSRKR